MLPAVLFSLLMFAPQQAPPVTPVATPAPDQPTRADYRLSIPRYSRQCPTAVAYRLLITRAIWPR